MYYELQMRLRGWWKRHWWPAQIRALKREHNDWRRWCYKAEDALQVSRTALAACQKEQRQLKRTLVAADNDSGRKGD